MKSKINLFLTMALIIIGCYSILNSIIQLDWLYLVGIAIWTIVFFVSYKFFYKLEYVGKEVKWLVVIVLLLLNTITQFLMCQNIVWDGLVNTFVNDLALLLTFLFVKRKTDYKSGCFVLFFSLFALPLLYAGEYNSILNLIVVLLGLSLVSVEYEYPFSIRNMTKFLIIGCGSAFLTKINMLFVVQVLLLILFLLKNIGKKKSLIILILISLVGASVQNLINTNDIITLFSSDYNLIPIYEEVALCAYFALFIDALIYSFLVSILKKYDDSLLKVNLIYVVLLLVALIINNFFAYNLANVILYFIFIYFSINNYEVRMLPRVNILKRYKKTRQIKKVSVVIPNYNYEHYIEERIDSIINQTYPIYELIVLDDKSTDNSVEVIKKKLKEVEEEKPDLIVKFIENETNSGNVFKQWQKAFELSTGDYLWIAEADDLCSKYFLNVTMESFNNEDVVLSYSESSLIDEDAKVIDRDARCSYDLFVTNEYLKSYIRDGKEELKRNLCTNNKIINVSGVVFKKDVYIPVLDILKGSQDFKLSGDWYFYSKYLLYGSIAYNCDSLNYHRIQNKGVTKTTSNHLKVEEAITIQKSIRKSVTLAEDVILRNKNYIRVLKKEYSLNKNVIEFNGIYAGEEYTPSLVKRLKTLFKKSLKGTKIDIYEETYEKVSGDKKVSVVIPNYNYENYIEERIDSVINQTYPIYELIILDDASKDNSVNVIKKKLAKIEKNYPNIKTKLIVNKENCGSVFEQWQKAFTESTGDYVWIAEADDSCHPEFLEQVMEPFSDEEVILSYAESMRINENNVVINDDCRDWMVVVSHDRWDKSYIKDGSDEIKESLCICNTIPNVSAVVFKKSNQVEMIENCKKFKISGDWYLYYQILQTGKISYCAKSLNYFRKHSNSTSTVAKKDLELEELLIIQSEIRNNVLLLSKEISKQRDRYRDILLEVEDSTLKKLDKYMVKKIAWIIPHPIKGSGGIRTMIQNANYLVSIGYEVDIYVEEDYCTTDKDLKNQIIKYYGYCFCNTYVGIELRKEYDLVFATYSILTADYVNIMDIPKKAYFIQDFEPWFEAMGNLYLEMEHSYKYGLEGISIGNWLANKITNEFNAPMHSFPFCADLNVYKKNENIEKEDAICFIYQPEKSRRCSNLGLKALKIVKKLRPNFKIYLYGSNTGDMSSLGLENLGIIKIDKCSELYNKCKVGLCISASNPSRIPFEMMACGLPVVDLYRENNLYDIPSNAVLLADATPEGLATALIKIIDDENLQKNMAEKGLEFMKNYPLEKGFEVFGKFVSDYLNDNLKKDNIKGKMYDKEAILPSEEVLEVSSIVSPMPVSKAECSNRTKKKNKIMKIIKRKYNDFIIRVFMVR